MLWCHCWDIKQSGRHKTLNTPICNSAGHFLIIHECKGIGTPFTVLCGLLGSQVLIANCTVCVRVLPLSIEWLGSKSVYDYNRWYSDDISCVRSVGEFMFYKVVLRIGVTMMDMCDNDNVCVTHGPLFAVVTRGYVIHRMNLTTSEVDNGTQRTNEIRHSQPRHMMCGTRTANSHHLHRLAR